MTLAINGQTVTVPAGTTIREAARTIGVDVPTVCYHPHFTANSLCRVCVVEMERSRVLVPACSRAVENDMVIFTDSPRVRLSRRTILELMHSAVDLSQAPEIMALLREYQADDGRFAGVGETLAVAQRDLPLHDDNAMYIRDYSKCILCWRCVQACGTDIQYTFALSLGGRGFQTRVATYFDAPIPETTCVYCGNCVAACPTGALKGKREWLIEQGKPLEPMPLGPKRRRRRADGEHLDLLDDRGHR
ncbi:MAG: (2Fe-2S)-binding protein [Chloroflexi bacterium]|nr:(2Fe-2S)-binding protein [Chloroflexota bacterium]